MEMISDEAPNAMRAALEAADRAAWQPIEAAPRDRKSVFLHILGHGTVRALWRERMGWEDYAAGWDITSATHWRHLFPSPEVAP